MPPIAVSKSSSVLRRLKASRSDSSEDRRIKVLLSAVNYITSVDRLIPTNADIREVAVEIFHVGSSLTGSFTCRGAHSRESLTILTACCLIGETLLTHGFLTDKHIYIATLFHLSQAERECGLESEDTLRKCLVMLGEEISRSISPVLVHLSLAEVLLIKGAYETAFLETSAALSILRQNRGPGNFLSSYPATLQHLIALSLHAQAALPIQPQEAESVLEISSDILKTAQNKFRGWQVARIRNIVSAIHRGVIKIPSAHEKIRKKDRFEKHNNNHPELDPSTPAMVRGKARDDLEDISPTNAGRISFSDKPLPSFKRAVTMIYEEEISRSNPVTPPPDAGRMSFSHKKIPSFYRSKEVDNLSEPSASSEYYDPSNVEEISSNEAIRDRLSGLIASVKRTSIFHDTISDEKLIGNFKRSNALQFD